MAYTELDLRKLKGQALKDVWHQMIGKEVGIKNTTGLKNSEEILQAILKGQEDPLFLEPFKKVRTLTHKASEPASVVEMPKKLKANPIVVPKATKPGKVRTEAVELTDLPLYTSDVQKTKVKKFHLGSTIVYIDTVSNIVYEAIGNTPGAPCGTWDPETRQLMQDE